MVGVKMIKSVQFSLPENIGFAPAINVAEGRHAIWIEVIATGEQNAELYADASVGQRSPLRGGSHFSAKSGRVCLTSW